MQCHKKLAEMLDAGELEPFVRHLRFPEFKNLVPGTRIDFDHPITALVGPNGTNKTSLLRALQGCANYSNYGNYYFATKLDPETGVERPRFIHGYKTPSGATVESLKVRIKEKQNPDYFEPSRPILSDGMDRMPDESDTPEPDRSLRSKTRWNAIDKRVVYLDFRHDIPAFDIFFHFNDYRRNNDFRSKKALVRRRAPHVAGALNAGATTHTYHRKERILTASRSLTPEAVHHVSQVLGRQYSGIKILRHTYYDFDGYTVRLEAGGLSYSEAFAGSGEYAATMIVDRVMTAPERSLIILDEPEVSLHPGAQRSLMAFLGKQAIRRCHQIVMSTHSPDMIESLPDQAIKVLERDAATHAIGIPAQASPAQYAFRHVGASSERSLVIVEDRLSSAVITTAIRSKGNAFLDSFEIQPYGSESVIRSSTIPHIARMGTDVLVLLDGDCTPSHPLRPCAAVPDAEVLDEIKKIGIEKKHLGVSGGNAANDDEAIVIGKKILTWAESSLHFLPGANPEEQLLKWRGISVGADGAKETWVQRTRDAQGMLAEERPTNEEILALQKRELAAVPNDEPDLVAIREILQSYLSRVAE